MTKVPSYRWILFAIVVLIAILLGVLLPLRIERKDVKDKSTTVLDNAENSETSPPSESKIRRRPNIIVMQPDDFPFYAEWTPPPSHPIQPPCASDPNRNLSIPCFTEFFPNGYTMPNLERLRKQGLQMMQAYTSSSMCSTSRFSTITGRYPSRSKVARQDNLRSDNATSIASISVMNTKLSDIRDGVTTDCTKENLAVLLQTHGYRTGVVGKWHLSEIDRNDYTYEKAQQLIQQCGFDYADGIYVENMEFFLNASHNQEWVTAKAIDFINRNYTAYDQNHDQTKPFFLYFNPTVPHPHGLVKDALHKFSCKNTPAGVLDQEPIIPKMTAEYQNCTAYRDSIFQRAGNYTTNHDLGAIWIDDSVGSLFYTLEQMGELQNTIFLFQIDHGIEAKSTHWENGNRIAQFVHYPDEFGTAGMKMTLPVSTIDVAPTMLDFAGVTEDLQYQMDGVSWKNAYYDANLRHHITSRCLFGELRKNRSLVCGNCHKLISLREIGSTIPAALYSGYAYDNPDMYFNLCSNDKYLDYPSNSTETTNIAYTNWDVFSTMQDVLACFLNKTSPQTPSQFNISSCDFTTFYDKYDGITAPPALEPTGFPTSAPTLSEEPSTSPLPTFDIQCIDQDSIILMGGPFVGEQRNCTWVAQRPARCNRHAFRCPVTCGLCNAVE